MSNAADSPSRATAVRYLVLAALCVATTIAYIDRGCISVAEEAVRRDLELSTQQMGELFGAFFITYAVFQIPTGWLGQVWGSRRALSVFCVAWSVATGIGALATGYHGMLISRLGMGAAEAGIFPCATSTIARWFPISRRAWAAGVLGSFMGVGAALGAKLTGDLMSWSIGWQTILAVYAVPGIIWSACFYLWFRDSPNEHRSVNAAEVELIGEAPAARQTAADQAEPTPWRAILSSSSMGWIAGQQFFRGAGYVFFMTWFPTYLRETRNVSTREAADLTSLALGAQIFGSFSGGVLSDWVLARTGSRRLSRQGLGVVSQLACALLILLAYPVADALLAVALITVGAFCASVGGPAAYAVTIDMGGKFVAPVFSVMNMAGNVGAVLFPVLVGRMVSDMGWDPVLFIFAGVHVLAACCWLAFDPNKKIV